MKRNYRVFRLTERLSYDSAYCPWVGIGFMRQHSPLNYPSTIAVIKTWVQIGLWRWQISVGVMSELAGVPSRPAAAWRP